MVTNNSINNTVGASNTGTNTLTVQNTSNTASSRANVNIVVGDSTLGTASGNPWTQYTVGGPSYAVGVANHAYTLAPNPPGYTLPEQALVVNTSNTSTVTPNSGSTTWSMSIGATPSGQTQGFPCINLPTQPAFYYFYNTSTAAVTGDGTHFTLGTNGTPGFTKRFDQGITSTGVYFPNVNVTNGIFTAPCAGIYFLSAGIVIGGVNTLGNNNGLAQLQITNGLNHQMTLQLVSALFTPQTPPQPNYSLANTPDNRVAFGCTGYVLVTPAMIGTSQAQFKADIVVFGSNKNIHIVGGGGQFFSFFSGHLVI